MVRAIWRNLMLEGQSAAEEISQPPAIGIDLVWNKRRVADGVGLFSLEPLQLVERKRYRFVNRPCSVGQGRRTVRWIFGSRKIAVGIPEPAIQGYSRRKAVFRSALRCRIAIGSAIARALRSEEHTSELQSRGHLVCRLLLEKKKKNK